MHDGWQKQNLSGEPLDPRTSTEFWLTGQVSNHPFNGWLRPTNKRMAPRATISHPLIRCLSAEDFIHFVEKVPLRRGDEVNCFSRALTYADSGIYFIPNPRRFDLPDYLSDQAHSVS